MATSSWNDILKRNREYAESKHEPIPFFSELTGPLPSMFIFVCLDPRVSVETFLNIATSDALIVRNAGGRVKKNINDLIFLETLTKEQALKDVIIIHHTDCGATHLTEESTKAALKENHSDLAHVIDGLEFGTIGSGENLEESVREDLAFLRSQRLIRQEVKDNAKGYIYDIKTGKLNLVH